MSTEIENTTATAQKNPASLLLSALLEGSPESIYKMEAEGQNQLCNSAQLPVDGSNDPRFLEMGIIFGEISESDPLFRPATLPEGWKVEPTDHSMWSNLVDEAGTVRASIFYKAAFYDRSAHIRISA